LALSPSCARRDPPDHDPGERGVATEHIKFAGLRDMKMQPALGRALRRRGLLKAQAKGATRSPF
jgi:hypothetical protein